MNLITKINLIKLSIMVKNNTHYIVKVCCQFTLKYFYAVRSMVTFLWRMLKFLFSFAADMEGLVLQSTQTW